MSPYHYETCQTHRSKRATNAEAFLGSKIVVCEGLTEIGCLRAYDVHRLDASAPPVWSLSTSYFNCGGASKIKPICPQLIQLGYEIGVLCDNDAADQLSEADVQNLRAAGAHVCQWERGRSTEEQLVTELPWDQVLSLLRHIGNVHDTIEYATILDAIRKDERLAALRLGSDPLGWAEGPLIRQVIGKLAKNSNWIKRIDYSRKVFAFAFPHLPARGVLMSRLDALWRWIQNE